jgi:hypothetical protein
VYTHSALPPFLAFYMADTGGKNIRVILENRCIKANQQKKRLLDTFDVKVYSQNFVLPCQLNPVKNNSIFLAFP